MLSDPPIQMPRPLVLGLLVVALGSGVARGQATSSGVIDGAGMFSEDALRKARAELTRLESARRVAVTIETVTSLKGESIDQAATDHARKLGHKGIFVFIAEKEHTSEVLAAPRTLFEELGKTRLNEIRDAFTAEFRRGKIDEGLTEGVKAAEKVLAAARPFANSAPDRTAPTGGLLPSTPTATAPAASSGDSPMILRQQVRLTLAGARKLIEGARAQASRSGWKMNVAVVDDGGHLVAFERMDGARPASVATATAKAVTAATYRQPTGPIVAPNSTSPDVLTSIGLQNATGGKVTTLLGGLPIVVDGQVIGAIGVGGGTGEQDVETAKAGLAAFLEGLKAKPEEPKEKPKEAEASPKARDQEIEAVSGKPAETGAKPK